MIEHCTNCGSSVPEELGRYDEHLHFICDDCSQAIEDWHFEATVKADEFNDWYNRQLANVIY